MRLLHARALEFVSFPDTKNRPPYAILSHTWGGDEITHQHFLQPELAHGTQGYRKIKAACEKTIELGLEYAWVDTVCIDKTNNTELSEAIKRMFEWYRASKVCLAYVVDVSGPDSGHEGLSNSRWFTRGWTLQELIAPKSMLFFNSAWEQIGSRADLASLIHGITGIDEVYLTGDQDTYSLLQEASIAEKMSWASRRSTTKEEDMAYCLFGIFDVNIPLMYGEGGTQAFQRLQMEIATQRFDPTLLVWESFPGGIGTFFGFPVREPLIELPLQSPWRSTCAAFVGKQHPWYAECTGYARGRGFQSLLAPSPASFEHAQGREFLPVNRSWLVSGNRLQISLPKSLDQEPYIVLPCFARENPHRLYAIPLIRRRSNDDGSAYSRAYRPLILVDSAAWNLWPQESITLDLGWRHGRAMEERVPYILHTPSLPKGLRCTGVSVGSHRQPYNPTIKIKAFKTRWGTARVSLSLEHEVSGETSALDIVISPRKWHEDLIPGIRGLVQSWYGHSDVQCDYTPKTVPTMYFPMVRQEQVLETTIVTVDLKQSLDLCSSVAFKLKALSRSWISSRLTTVYSFVSVSVVSSINVSALLLVLPRIFGLVPRLIPDTMPILDSFMENWGTDQDNYSVSTLIGFLILRHILISSIYLMPKSSSLVFQQIWFVDLLCFVSPMFSYEHYTLTYHFPSPILVLASLALVVSYVATTPCASTGMSRLIFYLGVVLAFRMFLHNGSRTTSSK